MSKKGFTLIELLVVIAIIGLLASIVIVNVNSGRGKARDTRRKSDFTQIRNALEMYYDKYGRYPYRSAAQGSVPEQWECGVGDLWCGSGCTSDSFLSNFLKELVDEGYFGKVPVDPQSVEGVYAYANWSQVDGRASQGCVNSDQNYLLLTQLERENPVGGSPDCSPVFPNPLPCVYVISSR